MKKVFIPMTILLMSLTSCGGNNNSSKSVSPSTPNSTSVAPSLNSTSVSTSNSTSTSTSISTSTSTTTTGKTLSFSATDLNETLTNEASSEEKTFTHDGMDFGFVGCNSGTYNGSTYIMMRKTSYSTGAGHFYNKTSLGKILSVALTFSASTSTNVTLAATFSDTMVNSAQTETNVTDAVTASGTITIVNSEDFDYFNLSVTNDYNCQITEVVITFAE